MISAQGIIIRRNTVPITEVRDVTLPALTREAVERTRWQEADDAYRVGIRQYGALQFEINLVPGDTTHEGLIEAYGTGSEDTYEVLFGGGAEWSFSGFVESIVPQAPVDNALRATVTIRPADAVSFGVLSAFLLQETGGRLLQENDGRIVL